MNFRKYLKKEKVLNQARLALAMGLQFPEEICPESNEPDLSLLVD